jgi:hypothetical protein
VHRPSGIGRSQSVSAFRPRIPSISIFPNDTCNGYRSLSSNASADGEEEQSLRRPFPSHIDQIKMFPVGVKRLISDIQTYFYINDAASTKTNSWNSTVPRRQQAFQRKLIKELQSVAVPVIGYAAIPVAGNAFVLLAIAFPKVFLSWHFLTPSQVRSFASDEHWFRIGYHHELADCIWSTVGACSGRGHGCGGSIVDAKSMRKHIEVTEEDAAGPIIEDIVPLWNLFGPGSGLDNVQVLPQQHVLTLARSSDLLRPPFDVSSFLLNFIPKSWTARQVDRIANAIVKDDRLLRLEGHHANGCESLTAEEVIDACLLRGLPSKMALNMQEMRRCLTNHLALTSQIPETADAAQQRSFLMHLPALRESLRS